MEFADFCHLVQKGAVLTPAISGITGLISTSYNTAIKYFKIGTAILLIVLKRQPAE